ncbi:hypothetical protein Tco_1086903 [Tanacetum coccineum]
MEHGCDKCDEDDATRQEAIMGIITLFEQAMAVKEDLRKQDAECKDFSPERRALIEKFLDDEARKDYEFVGLATPSGLGAM